MKILHPLTDLGLKRFRDDWEKASCRSPAVEKQLSTFAFTGAEGGSSTSAGAGCGCGRGGCGCGH